MQRQKTKKVGDSETAKLDLAIPEVKGILDQIDQEIASQKVKAETPPPCNCCGCW